MTVIAWSSRKRRLTLKTPRDACGKQVRSSALSGKLPCGGTCRSTLMRKCLRSPLWISLALDYHHHLPTLPAHPLPSLSLLDHVLTKATLPLKYLIGIKAQVAKHHPVSLSHCDMFRTRCGGNLACLLGIGSEMLEGLTAIVFVACRIMLRVGDGSAEHMRRSATLELGGCCDPYWP